MEYFKFFKIKVRLIYRIMLVSEVQHCNPLFLQIILHYRLCYYKMMSIFCAGLYILVACLFVYSSLYLLNPYHPPIVRKYYLYFWNSYLVKINLFSVFVGLFSFCIYIYIHLYYFLVSKTKWYHTVFVFSYVISRSIIFSSSIQIKANSSIFFLYG